MYLPVLLIILTDNPVVKKATSLSTPIMITNKCLVRVELLLMHHQITWKTHAEV